MSLPRVAIVCDLLEESWPSMDLVGEMLIEHLRRDHAGTVRATRVCPPMRRRFTRSKTSRGKLFNLDRLLNRFGDYPRLLSRRRGEFDLFHVVDHSYGQLLHSLPPERAVVTCHDLNTFRCLLDPAGETRSSVFKAMTKRILDGFRRAARVVCDSRAIRDELLAHGLIAPERLSVVPLGVHPSCTSNPKPSADTQARHLLNGVAENPINLLHVGSTAGRKRIDLLLKVTASVRKEFPTARLIRVGGAFSPAQAELVRRFKLEDAVVVLPYLERDVLAAIYRRATLLLQPSEREGFGLPVIESLACGVPVVASDLPVLREVGGDAAVYCKVGEPSTWAETLIQLLVEKSRHPEQWDERRAAGIRQAARFSWAEYTRNMVAIYQELL